MSKWPKVWAAASQVDRSAEAVGASWRRWNRGQLSGATFVLRSMALSGVVAMTAGVLAANADGGPTTLWQGDAKVAPAPAPAPAPQAKGEGEQRGDAASESLDSEQSIARFQQLLSKRPFHGPAFTSLVTHFIERNKLAELVAEYEAKVKALPDDVALKIVLARLHLRAGDAAKSATIVGAIETLPPALARQTSDLLAFKAEVFQRTGDVDGAERTLKTAMKAAASVSEELRLGEALADLYLSQQRKDDAVGALVALADKFPGQYLHQRHVADALAQRGLHEAAVERYKAMLPSLGAEVDRRCETLRQLGLSYEKLSKRDDAIVAYGEAIGLLAGDHWLQKELHERVVNLYRAANRLDDLATYCRTQIARAPEQTPMRVLLADVLVALGKPEEAKAALAEAVELFPSDITLSQKRVEFLDRTDDVPGAIAEHQRIISRHPDEAELYIAYGQFLAEHKQLDAARNQWQFVLGKHVSDAGLASRLGILFETSELLEDAAQAYERAVSLAPNQAEAYLSLSRLALLAGDRDKAVATLERGTAANPDDASMHAAVAGALVSLGQGEKALTAMERACAIAPTQVRYRQTFADLLVAGGRLDDALKVRREVLDLLTNPLQQGEAIGILVSMHSTANQLPRLEAAEQARLDGLAADAAPAAKLTSLLILAGAADARRDFAGQRAWLDKGLAIDPGNEVALRSLARLQDAVADVDGAIATWKKLISLHPSRSKPAYDAIVDLKLRYGDKAGAIETLDEMAKAEPDNVTVLTGVAEQLQRMGDPERALPYYETCLKLQPERHETRLEYGKALADAGRLEDALAAFRRVATQRSDTDSAVDALGRLHDTATQLGTLEELIDDLEKEVEIDPSNTLAARALAVILIREFEYGRAMTVLESVVRHNPRDIELALVRGELHRRLAQFDKAIEAYQVVLRQPQIDRDYVLGEIGKTNFEAGQVDQAKRIWKQISNRVYAGTLLKNNGMLDEAILVFEEGIRLKPDDFGLHRNLIGALEAAGRTDDALKAARRLLDLEPDNIANITAVADAHIKHGDRAGAAEVAARLFSASVTEKKTGTAPGQSQPSYSRYGYYGQRRSNLDRGIEFFQQNGMLAELTEVLEAQMVAQPDNAVLRMQAAAQFQSALGKPERSLAIWRELETAAIPLENQQWLGQCSQRDWFRMMQYGLVARMPAQRDAALARLDAKKVEELAPDELIELAVIRDAQGKPDAAIELLAKAVGDERDASPDALGERALARGALIDRLLKAERYAEAEPHAAKQVEYLATRREAMRAETIDRVRRDFVRQIPIEWQLRLTDALIAEIAEKWTLGQAFAGWSSDSIATMGYLRARLTMATIYAKTERMDRAREIWKDLAPKGTPDVDTLTTLGGVAQHHDQEDLAYDFYREAMRAARSLAGDALMRRIYASAAASSWYDEGGTVDASFNKIVAAFEKRDGLVDLYAFLRETNQARNARRIAEQYKLDGKLEALYRAEVEQARATYRSESSKDPFDRSVGYFAAVCKLAEVVDRSGGWERAVELYRSYLEDFNDELALLGVMGEVAEARNDLKGAIEWEKRVLDAKTRLSRRARQWNSRELTVTPSIPEALKGRGVDEWSWSYRWGGSNWYSGWGAASGGAGLFDRSASWLRLAELHLADQNPIAAGDAMGRAVADAGNNRDDVIESVLELIQERQLGASMLPVLRSLAVYAPSDQKVQLAFAESLDANKRPELAAEVCERMLRRGVSDLGVLEQVRAKLQALKPEAAPAKATLASLEAESKADPGNLKLRLQLGKAYYYSLDLDRAAAVLEGLAKEAPHLDEVHPLLVEIQTLRAAPGGDREPLIAAIKTQIDRSTNPDERRTAQWRLVDELLAGGRNDEALAVAKELGDPRDPGSYQRIAVLLHYFGRHEEAVTLAEASNKSQSRQQWGDSFTDMSAVSAYLKGDVDDAIRRILKEVDESAQTQVQYTGQYAMYNRPVDYFASFKTVMILEPRIAEGILKAIEARRAEKPDDPQTAKVLMSLHQTLGRPDLADALLEQIIEKGTGDQGSITLLIDKALARKEYERAIKLAREFIASQPKPQIDPGMPSQYAGQMLLQSPRSMMTCKLGDVLWKMGEKEKAFESYREIVDEKADETKLAYASICLSRGRTDEARTLLDAVLAGQQVKAPNVLKLRAFIAALEGKTAEVFDLMMTAVTSQAGSDESNYWESSPLDTLVGIAQNLGSEEMFQRLVTFVNERIEKSPTDWENYNALITMYLGAGRAKEALAVLDRADAVPTLTLRSLGQRLAMEQPHVGTAELIPLYRRQIELSEREVSGGGGRGSSYGGMYQPAYGGGGSSPQSGSRVALGELLWESGDREGAMAEWTTRVNLKDASTQYWLGTNFLGRQERELAERHFLEALRYSPEHAAAHLALADLCSRKGDRRGAFEHMLLAFVKRQNSSASRSDGSWYAGMIDDPRMHQWAIEIARDTEALSAIEGAKDGDEAGRDRIQGQIMLAMLTANWTGLESALTPLIQSNTVDPMMWRLWATVQQRRGNHEEAARAWDFIRRAQKTTIADHRAKLELAFAGKQIREAAGGTRQTGSNAAVAAAAAAAAARAGSSRGSSYWYGADGTSSELAAIYVRLGKFADAERLYLLSSGGGGLSGSLPAVAGLLWQQGSTERALELMRLGSLVVDQRYSGRSSLPQYAQMLADAGKTDEAIDLLVRGYRMTAPAEGQNNYYGYGYYYQDEPASVDSGEDQQYATTLHGVLTRAGRLKETLAKLAADAAKDPNDVRLSRLVVSLETRSRAWAELDESLGAWRAKRTADEALEVEQMHADAQLGQWDEALAIVERLKRHAPERRMTWSMQEAFLQLMAGRAEAAVAAIGEIVADPIPALAQVQYQAVVTILASAGRVDQLAAFASTVRERGDAGQRTSASGTLVPVLASLGRWDEAAAIAVDEAWRSPMVLHETHGWYRSLVDVVQRAAQANGRIDPASFKDPCDAALVTLAREGSTAGAAAFRALLTDGVEFAREVKVRRGILLAALIDGDARAIAEATEATVALLAPHRRDGWYLRRGHGLQDLARGQQKMMELGDAMSFAFSGNFEGFSTIESELRGTSELTYEPLWAAHQRFQRGVLASAGDVTSLDELLRTQRRSLTATRSDDSDRYDYRQGYSTNRLTYDDADDDQGATNDQAYLRDVRWFARALLWQNATRPEAQRALLDLVRSTGPDLPNSQWPLAADIEAAVGDERRAAELRRAHAELTTTSLVAGDAPRFANQYYYWGYYNYSRQDVDAIRQQFSTSVATIEPDNPDRAAGGIQGVPDQAWEAAMLDPQLADILLRSEPYIGPGWESSRTLPQLLAYYDATGRNEDVVKILDRVYSGAKKFSAAHLGPYIKACIKLKRFDTVEAILDRALAVSDTLKNDVAVMRLMLLRHRGMKKEADTLESSLVADCLRERPNPMPVAPNLVRSRPSSSSGAAAPFAYQSQSQGQGQSQGQATLLGRALFDGPDGDSSFAPVPTVVSLAQQLGVRFQSQVAPGDLTLGMIRGAYTRHGFHADAARIARMELDALDTPQPGRPRSATSAGATAMPAADGNARLALQASLVESLRLSGDAQATQAAAAEYEKALLAARTADPSDVRVLVRLADFYRSSAGGRQFAKAREALESARKMDTRADRYGLGALECLCKEGRYTEAWPFIERALANGVAQSFSEPLLFHAALAADAAGQADVARALARLAAHRYPSSPLIAKVDSIRRTAAVSERPE